MVHNQLSLLLSFLFPMCYISSSVLAFALLNGQNYNHLGCCDAICDIQNEAPLYQLHKRSILVLEKDNDFIVKLSKKEKEKIKVEKTSQPNPLYVSCLLSPLIFQIMRRIEGSRDKDKVEGKSYSSLVAEGRVEATSYVKACLFNKQELKSTILWLHLPANVSELRFFICTVEPIFQLSDVAGSAFQARVEHLLGCFWRGFLSRNKSSFIVCLRTGRIAKTFIRSNSYSQWTSASWDLGWKNESCFCVTDDS
ncbi:hypothetical protein VNO78_24047 [Psophocarpus tetragonolobus]|uniref:Uncharacterized protein n=1 Tax=Psophocarpus tetragonolobus TaxID=3891 RepID=A0AAN9S543_PSOTE